MFIFFLIQTNALGFILLVVIFQTVVLINYQTVWSTFAHLRDVILLTLDSNTFDFFFPCIIKNDERKDLQPDRSPAYNGQVMVDFPAAF